MEPVGSVLDVVRHADGTTKPLAAVVERDRAEGVDTADHERVGVPHGPPSVREGEPLIGHDSEEVAVGRGSSQVTKPVRPRGIDGRSGKPTGPREGTSAAWANG